MTAKIRKFAHNLIMNWLIFNNELLKWIFERMSEIKTKINLTFTHSKYELLNLLKKR
jgi:hypothetical protein